MAKKLAAVLLSMLLVLSLAACKRNIQDTSVTDTNTQAVSENETESSAAASEKTIQAETEQARVPMKRQFSRQKQQPLQLIVQRQIRQQLQNKLTIQIGIRLLQRSSQLLQEQLPQQSQLPQGRLQLLQQNQLLQSRITMLLHQTARLGQCIVL